MMLKSMERRLRNIAERFEYRQNIKFRFFRPSSDDQELDLVHHRSKDNINKSLIGCAPSITQHAIHQL